MKEYFGTNDTIGAIEVATAPTFMDFVWGIYFLVIIVLFVKVISTFFDTKKVIDREDLFELNNKEV